MPIRQNLLLLLLLLPLGCCMQQSSDSLLQADQQRRPFISLSSAQAGFFGGNFSFSSPPTRAKVSHTYLALDNCLCTLASSLPHLPTYLPAHLPTHLPISPSTYLHIYLPTKSPPRQWQRWSMKVVHESIAMYQVGCFILLPTYLPTRPCIFMTMENNVAMTPTGGIVTKLNFFYVAL